MKKTNFSYKLEFGFLPEELSVPFGDGEISPLHNFSELISLAKGNCVERNGFYYSPTYISEREGVKKHFTPSHFMFFRTHELKLNFAKGDILDLRKNPAFFLLQVVGYVTGYRIMPAQYNFDLRVPSSPRINTVRSPQDISTALNVALKSWKSWKPNRRIAMTNLLFIFNRNPSYHWDFERFDFEYKIIDTCGKLRSISGSGHADRLGLLLKDLGIAQRIDRERVREIVSVRNGLIHELKWGRDLIAGKADEKLFRATEFLHRLNHRVLGRMLGLRGEYFGSTPSRIGPYSFGPILHDGS